LRATTDDLNARGDALMDLADILGLAGLADERAAIVTQALRLYDQKGNVVSAKRARTLLRQLQADHVSA
jgi:hypothetical protein